MPLENATIITKHGAKASRVKPVDFGPNGVGLRPTDIVVSMRVCVCACVRADQIRSLKQNGVIGAATWTLYALRSFRVSRSGRNAGTASVTTSYANGR